MINISDRLKAIALEILSGETMADIGTDHGFLPVYLWERNICPKVILTDISSGSLKKAEECCRSNYPKEDFDLRQGSGLEILERAEVEDVVIAGMGGLLMISILEKDLEKSRSFKKYILQPRSAAGPLRHWLIHSGFSIEGETLVREGKNICEILTVAPGREKIADLALMQEPADSIKWEVPLWYGEAGDELTEEYICRKIAKEKNILYGMRKGTDVDTKMVEKNIEYLEELLEV
ncbi:MAG: tRNA (adenine(22)-N(1))-methyltransferase TrmK [Eubacteriaceae bacterium]|nr:tRNA (adenine(22)-N(1))-methyltransferase TrmK [Eubacteriaceae bacterium]